eukprot:scaffold141_cov410-Prasinococcus_capsulatus_cf.AAC.12
MLRDVAPRLGHRPEGKECWTLDARTFSWAYPYRVRGSRAVRRRPRPSRPRRERKVKVAVGGAWRARPARAVVALAPGRAARRGAFRCCCCCCCRRLVS